MEKNEDNYYNVIVYYTGNKLTDDKIEKIKKLLKENINEYDLKKLNIGVMLNSKPLVNVSNNSVDYFYPEETLKEIEESSVVIAVERNFEPHLIKNRFTLEIDYYITLNDLKDPLKLLKFHYMMWDEIAEKGCKKNETNIIKYIRKKFFNDDEYMQNNIIKILYSNLCFLCILYYMECEHCCLADKYGKCKNIDSMWMKYIDNVYKPDELSINITKECAIKIRDVIIPEIIKNI